MAVSFVLMHVSPILENNVLHHLSKVDEVVDIHPLFGEYNLMAKIEAKEYENIGDIVLNKIRTINGIIDTTTLTGIKMH